MVLNLPLITTSTRKKVSMKGMKPEQRTKQTVVVSIGGKFRCQSSNQTTPVVDVSSVDVPSDHAKF